MSHYLKKIAENFSADARHCLDTAVSQAISRTHHEVSIEHLLLALVTTQPELIEKLCMEAGLQGNRLVDALTQSLNTQRSGNSHGPVLSESLVRHLEKAWLHASVCWHHPHLPATAFLGCLITDLDDITLPLPAEVRQALHCDVVKAEGLMVDFTAASQKKDNVNETAQSCGPALMKYTHNLTEKARRGELDPVTGREHEIRQMIDVLLRRRQNNPILTGEPGVGKTALVEGLAQRIVIGTVPDALKKMDVMSLDLGLLQAGASVKGEFENRLQSLLSEIKSHPVPVILFIDEAHMLIGAGGAAGQNDAANLLKPAMARGELRMIGATTWSEYKKYFEKDAALARRFQIVRVAEPDRDTAINMLRTVVPYISSHHGIPIPDSAIVAAVDFSARYIPGRQLPDKSVTLLDTACARVALSQNEEPRVIEDLNVMLRNISLERRSLSLDSGSEMRITWLAKREAEIHQDLAILTPIWKEQQSLVSRIIHCEDPEQQEELRQTLSAMHKQQPMVYERVDTACVAEIVAGWTGIPVEQILEKKQGQQLSTLLERLSERVTGQSHALAAIVRQIRASRAGLADPSKPVGVFMLAGPSGTGKTETALALAEMLHGGSKGLITLNMSEYQEAHSVAGLKGSPPGYVGYGQGGVLTEAIRRQPYSVVLIDEAEKAHRDVMELFYQVFDKGFMEDSEGQTVDFRNTLIILTSNLADDLIMTSGGQDSVDTDELTHLIRPEFSNVFPAAFMGRLTLLPYLPLSAEALDNIIKTKLRKVSLRFSGKDRENKSLSYSPAVVRYIAERCYVRQSGARDIDTVINRDLLPLLTDYLLESHDRRSMHIRVQVTRKRLVIVSHRQSGRK
ncbi:type VI secretion system ATPase TssH [Pantoea agglomerans]|uniref:type VI secretion system ATPase TssH n=1 Tax=Enterobacter agglomerans TaxID=549 RepID=UPI002413A751|nr:type VI secretion system ATPase TssH [Pantoea agglomerans]